MHVRQHLEQRDLGGSHRCYSDAASRLHLMRHRMNVRDPRTVDVVCFGIAGVCTVAV